MTELSAAATFVMIRIAYPPLYKRVLGQAQYGGHLNGLQEGSAAYSIV
jgi:hypothetical protein